MLKNVIDTTKIALRVVLLSFSNISISTPWYIKHYHACQQKDGFYFTRQFYFYLLLNPYISNISNIYNPDKNLSLAYQTIFDHMFSDTKSDHFFLFFCYVLGLYFFLSYVAIFHLLRIWEGVGIHCNLIPSLIESAPARILFPSQYITKFLILIGEVFLK